MKPVDQKVINGIRNAVKARGEDWRYPNGRVDDDEVAGFIPDADWCLEDGSCVNLLRDGSAACIIGFIAVDQGLPTIRESTASNDGQNWDVSHEVRFAMSAAQLAQDRGYTWGKAAKDFFDHLDANDFKYDLDTPEDDR